MGEDGKADKTKEIPKFAYISTVLIEEKTFKGEEKINKKAAETSAAEVALKDLMGESSSTVEPVKNIASKPLTNEEKEQKVDSFLQSIKASHKKGKKKLLEAAK